MKDWKIGKYLFVMRAVMLLNLNFRVLKSDQRIPERIEEEYEEEGFGRQWRIWTIILGFRGGASQPPRVSQLPRKNR